MGCGGLGPVFLLIFCWRSPLSYFCLISRCLDSQDLSSCFVRTCCSRTQILVSPFLKPLSQIFPFPRKCLKCFLNPFSHVLFCSVMFWLLSCAFVNYIKGLWTLGISSREGPDWFDFFFNVCITMPKYKLTLKVLGKWE